MTMAMDFRQLAQDTGGSLVNESFGTARFRGVSIDTRTLQESQLFVAIKGEKDDGHKYITSAISQKCAGILVDREFRELTPLYDVIPVVAVKNTHEAMIQLAVQRRQGLSAKAVCITGSNGKTTTKEMTYAVIKNKEAHCYRSPGNLNNLFGLPLALFAMPDDTRVAVLELGISVRGEMTHLAQIARPDLIIITNVGPTHLETLGTVEGVAEAKLELVDNAAPEVPVIINGDDPVLMKAARKRRREFITFGLNSSAAFKARPTGISSRGFQTAEIEGVEVEINLFGEHQVYNLLAAYAAARTLGLEITPSDLNRIKFTSEKYRGEIENIDGLIIIADCYNANPASMHSGLKSLRRYLDSRRDKSGRSFVVLGDMLELGARSADYHRTLGESLGRYNFDFVLTTGPMAREINAAAIKGGCPAKNTLHFDVLSSVGDYMIDSIRRGDIVYLKASRGIGLEQVLTMLKGAAFRHN